MKKLTAFFTAVLMVIAMTACGEKEEAPYIEAAKLNDDEKAMAKLMDTEYNFFDFHCGEDTKEIVLRVRELDGNSWGEPVDESRIVLSEDTEGRIAVQFDAHKGISTLGVIRGDDVTKTKVESSPLKEFTTTAGGTAFLTDKKDIVYNEEISLLTQIITDSSTTTLYNPDFKEDAARYADKNYEAVFTVTAEFCKE